MTSSPTPPEAPDPPPTVQKSRLVLVMDPPGPADEHPLAETIRAAGYFCEAAVSLQDLRDRLATGEVIVAAIAFEALWPTPQQALREIRQTAPDARLVIVHREGSPRLRLGQRLWSVHLIDYLIPRSMPPHQLRSVLQQAHADALIERSARQFEVAPGRAPGSPEIFFEFLRHLTQAMNTARRLDELLRVFHRKLFGLIDYQLVQVLLCNATPHRLFGFPAVRLPDDCLWRVAEHAYATIAPHLQSPPSVEDASAFYNPPFAEDDTDEQAGSAQVSSAISLPLFVQGELLGCLSVLPAPTSPLGSDKEAFLALLASHLSTVIFAVETSRRAEETGVIDPMTGLPGRRHLATILPSEWSRARRYGSHLTVAIVDIDRFDEVNQKHGYPAGDQVLRNAGMALKQKIRSTDHLVHYGGNAFLLVLPQTDPSEAAIAVERLRLAFKKEPILVLEQSGPLQITCSAGLASYPVCPVESAEALIDLATQSLRSAKKGGRDSLVVASGGSIETVLSGPEQRAGADKRRFPRIPTDLAVRYIELPDFEGHLASTRSLNINARGLAIEDQARRLKKHHYALVYIEDAQSPVLSRVVWTRDDLQGQRSVGLQFLQSDEIDPRVRATQRIKASPRALVITDKASTWDHVQRVLIAARYQMRVLRDGMPLPTPDEIAEYALVVVGDGSLRGWFGEHLRQIRGRLRAPGRIVVINESAERGEALRTIASHEVQHFVSADDRADEALFATLNKLLVGEYFGMQKYLLWGANPKSWAITRREDKAAVLDGVRQLAHEVYCHPRIVDLLVAAVDEMLINAMYEGRGDQASKGTVTVECGTDGRLLAVSVTDERGAFVFEDLHRALDQGLSRGTDGLPPNVESSSLGFRVMLDCLSQLAINVDVGRRTEVIGIVDLRKPLREYRRSVPSLGLFTKQDQEKPAEESGEVTEEAPDDTPGSK